MVRRMPNGVTHLPESCGGRGRRRRRNQLLAGVHRAVRTDRRGSPTARQSDRAGPRRAVSMCRSSRPPATSPAPVSAFRQRARDVRGRGRRQRRGAVRVRVVRPSGRCHRTCMPGRPGRPGLRRARLRRRWREHGHRGQRDPARRAAHAPAAGHLRRGGRLASHHCADGGGPSGARRRGGREGRRTRCGGRPGASARPGADPDRHSPPHGFTGADDRAPAEGHDDAQAPAAPCPLRPLATAMRCRSN